MKSNRYMPFSWLDKFSNEEDIQWASKYLGKKHTSFSGHIANEQYLAMENLLTLPHAKLNLSSYTGHLKTIYSSNSERNPIPIRQYIKSVDQDMKKAWSSYKRRKTSSKVQRTYFLSRDAISQLAKLAKEAGANQETTLDKLIMDEYKILINHEKEVKELKGELKMTTHAKNELRIDANDQLANLHEELITELEKHIDRLTTLESHILKSNGISEGINKSEMEVEICEKPIREAIQELQQRLDRHKTELNKRNTPYRQARKLAHRSGIPT